MNTFVVDGVTYKIVRNPYTNGPMIARVDDVPIDNRKEVCRRFLKMYGWSDDMFKNKITNYLESQINKIINDGVIPGERVNKSSLKKKKTSKVKESIDSVIVVRMYAGEYLDENIGHEIINTFKTDNGKHFIYISPWGMVNQKYASSKNVLLVRGLSADVWEVIGYASKLELLLSKDAVEDGRHREIDLIDSDIQLKLIRDRGITYGGVPINEILSEQKQVVYVTYETHEYHSLKEGKQLFLVDNKDEIKGDNYIFLPNVKFGRQTLHMYMDEKERKDAYDTLMKLFKNKKLWANDSCHKIDNLDAYSQTFNILDVIKRDEDELTFSNWLAYYLANDQAFLESFTKEILGIKMDGSKTIVKREYKNIDIWLEDDKNVIVIENKIKSGINGVVEERHDFSRNEVKSQLSKYVSIAEEEASGRHTKFSLLIPDYGVKDEELEMFQEYERYLPVIRYSTLLAFLNSHNSNLPYYEDYKKAVQKHASLYKKNLYQIMEERLINKIRLKKNAKKVKWY